MVTWEQRKVSDYGVIVTGSTPSTTQLNYYNGDYLFVSPIDIQGNRYVENTKTTLTKEGFNTGRLVRQGSTLFVSIGSTIGKVGQASVDLVTNQQINSIVPIDDYEDDFVFVSLLKTSALIKSLASNQAVPIVNKTDFGKTKVFVPNSKEQIKIGNFFKQFDETITLYESELKILKLMKKGFLQQLFPENKQLSPNIRFENFQEKWQQRKLGEVAKFSKGKGYTKNDLVQYGFKIILYGRMYTKYETVIESIDTYVENNEDCILSFKDDVIMPSSGESSLDIVRASVVPYAGMILGGDINIIELDKKIMNPIFIVLSISNGTLKKEISNLAQGNSVVHLYNSELKKVNVKSPVIQEQEIIGNFFKQLDKIITLQEKELENLKNIKSAFLQKMFI
ncbi:restriction endonuclease subunit S [Vagococcus fluvialis]|uniref:restriction endonuclease subunit S n=1 Tax=Vagococcus fluvialis TaxID=2738 RepID=UPI0037B71F07